jgi:membrane-bound serine protease (ClpP class)
VVDFVADDMADLVKKLNGREIRGFGALNTEKSVLEDYVLSRRQKILATISDPNVAMILMSLGAAGLFIELYSPGLIFPGVVGAISLVLAFYSFQTLSANYAGIGLILLGFMLFLVEIKVVSYGLLTAGGIISLILGMLMLFNTESSFGLSVSYSVMFWTSAGLACVTGIMVYIVAKAFGRKVVTGRESLIGAHGIAKTAITGKGTVLVDGELWDAVSDEEIASGAKIIVQKIDRFTLKVRKA